MRSMTMKAAWPLVFVLAACGKQEAPATGAAASTPVAPKTELVVYAAADAEMLPSLKQAFEAENPDISINWVRDSTGIITARLLAEKDRPQADAVWGMAVSSVILLKQYGMLEPYAPKGVELLDPRFVDAEQPPSWIGMDAFEATICTNTIETTKLKLPVPKSWDDLTDPIYKGRIAMPNPASSGTGFLTVVSWLQMMGEEKGWAYMDKLHANMALYTHSGAKPCKAVAAGELVAAVGLGFTAAKQKTKGAPISIHYPEEGVGWDMEAACIIKGTAKLDAVKRLMDFAASRKANEVYNKAYPVVAFPGVAGPVENYPADVKDKMIKMDFVKSAADRDRILGEWQRRYDGKSEPKG